MTSTLTFPDLPADHPLNTGKGIISVHGSEVLTDPELLIHPAKPPVNKRYRSGRTCKNCILYHCRSDFKAGCWYHDDEPARNPRARALRCRMFDHWNDAFDNIMADSLRKS